MRKQHRYGTSDKRARRRSWFAQDGQSITEFAILLPILLILLLGIGDFARLYATRITIESAAREAADWGAFHPGRWSQTGTPPVFEQTVAEMKRRACSAASHLPEYSGSSGNADCSNPSFECALLMPSGTPQDCMTPSDCSERLGSDPSVVPCSVEVTLDYTFDLIAPSGLLGIPSSLSFSTSSIFALADDPAPTQ
jgi:hypothetical protein